MSKVRCKRRVAGSGYLLIALFVSLASAHGQKYEISPLIGGAFGGTIKLEQALTPNVDAHVAALGPAETLQFHEECSVACLGFRGVAADAAEHADTPEVFALLRQCR